MLAHNVSVAQIYGETIVNWDFAAGIPQNWIVGINSTTDLAQWEYRGPATNPGINVGARGSCAAIAQPITSETQSNGFVIFDGNYWDDSGSACGAGLGSGIDPAPHTAWLITESLDFTEISAAVLTFQQQYRHFQATTKVQISTDGGIEWIDIAVNTETQSPNVEWKSVNISEWAAGQPSVQFKFIYQGTYYWWLLDDISVYVPNENDLILTRVGYTANPDVGGLPSNLNLEYDQYPQLFSPDMLFSCETINVGSQAQTGVRLNARVVKDGSQQVFNSNSAAQTVVPSDDGTFTIAGSYSPNTGLGDYKIFFSLLQDSTDQSPLNNTDSLDFRITPFTYAKDEGAMENTYIPDIFYEQYQAAFGNFFNNPDEDHFCHSIQVGIAEGTSVGKQIRGVIYDQDYDSLLAVTEVYEVNFADLNEPGEERMAYLNFEDPFEMLADSNYLVLVQEIDSLQPFLVARSGKSYGESSLIRYTNINASLISNKSFLVRMSIFAEDARPGCTDATAFNYLASADVDDGSCRYIGCTNEDADNFNPEANFDDGSCAVGGCTDADASNFNVFATYDNGNCLYPGCTTGNALNFDPGANLDDGSCEYLRTSLAASNVIGCPPLTFSVSNTQSYGDAVNCSYSINGTEFSESCDSVVTYTLSQSGIYTLSYTIALGTATADTTLVIEVLSEPTTPLLEYDANEQVIFCSNCDENVQYEWLFNGETVANANTNSIDAGLFGEPQNGTYTLQIVNNEGCGSSAAAYELLEPQLTASTLSGCAPLAVSFLNITDTVSNMVCHLQTGIMLVEDFSGAIDITYTNAGTYQAELTCTGATTSNSFALTVEVFEPFVPELSIDSDQGLVICSNCTPDMITTWNIDGTITQGGIQQPLGGDIYQIQAATINGCGGSDLLIVNDIGQNSAFGVRVFPNPANSLCTVLADLPVRIEIWDISGRCVQARPFYSTNHTVDVSALSDGIYTIRILGEHNTAERKLLVQQGR